MVLPPATTSPPPFDPIIVACLILSAVLHTILGVSINGTKLVIAIVRFIVKLALLHQNRAVGTDFADDILRHLPIDPRTASSRLDLLPDLAIYASCPRCSWLYAPVNGGTGSPYPHRCTNRGPDGRPCNAQLVTSRVVGTRLEWRAIRRFPYRDPSGFIANLYSRPDLEQLLDSRRVDVRDPCGDIWDAELLANFVGPDTLPFCTRGGHLAFALAIDWFNPYQNLEAKKKWSIGAVYLVCLNLPPEERFKIENVCLVAVIPGPKEPALEAINIFLDPIVKSFLALWNPGLWIPSTQEYPLGRAISAIIAILVADLLGARHVTGFTYPTHSFFCSYCMLHRDYMDVFDKSVWPIRKLDDHNRRSIRWRDAGSQEEQIRVANTYGLRWSPMSLLPYWNPFRQVGVDGLHMWMNILAKHAREAWRMSITLEAGDGKYDPLYAPPDAMAMAIGEYAVQVRTKTQLGSGYPKAERKDPIKANITKKVLVELCIRRGIRTGGRARRYLLQDLHQWVSSQLRVLLRPLIRSSCPAN